MKRSTKATTLFDLKDEYLKAKEKSFKTGLNNDQNGNKSKSLRDIIQYGKKEKDENDRKLKEKHQKRQKKLAMTEKEEADLAKSHSLLEAKSRLYDKLKGVDNDELREKCLVDFSQKEYVAKDDRDEAETMDYNEARNYEEEQPESSSTHFAHVDHGEVRSKGVGFYTFSQDTETRAQQMEFLEDMRESTERSREMFITQKKQRDKEKLDWLNRIRKKKGWALWDSLPGAQPEDNVTESHHVIARPVQEEEKVSIEEFFLRKDQSLWEKRVENLRDERVMDFAPTYDGPIDEESDEILNFISMVRKHT